MCLDVRGHNRIERSHSYTLPSSSHAVKQNQDFGNVSIENTPRKRAHYKSIRTLSGETIDIVHNIPTDVLSHENKDLFSSESFLEANSSGYNRSNFSNVNTDNAKEDQRNVNINESGSER